MVVNSPNVSDGYLLRENIIRYGDKSHLLRYDTVPPQESDLYVRAVKIKDKFGKDIEYDPNTSDHNLDSGVG